MEEWLGIMSGFGNKGMDQVGFFPFLAVMGISLLSSFFISFMYVRFYKARSTGSQIYRAFPLLSISITAIFITIQFSLPLSLGLLGALSIVRFRTPVKEPEEIGFIMLVVAAALCCATFNMLFLSIILVMALIALLTINFGSGFLDLSNNNSMLVIVLPGEKYKTAQLQIVEVLDHFLKNKRLDSLVEENGNVTLSYNVLNAKESDILALQNSLQDVDTVITTSMYSNSAVI